MSIFLHHGKAACAVVVRGRAAAVVFLLSAVLAGCNRSAPSKPGQALANVNGNEITVLQLNEEIQRAGVPAARQADASKQLLQALIDRELLEHAALQEKLDRDPKVIQAIERARSLIIAQAYVQKRLANMVRPTPAEVEAYYKTHPDYFDKRKQFRMDQLLIAAADLTPEVRGAADTARSLEEVAVWLDAHGIKYGRGQITRTTAELNPALSKKLLALPKGQLFSVREGERAMLLALTEVRDAPVPLNVAASQIAQFLMTHKNKELVASEVERLRKGAHIEYLNKDLAPAPGTVATDAPEQGASGTGLAHAAGLSHAPAVHAAPPAGTLPPAKAGPAPTAAARENTPADTAQPDAAAVDRGVAGLK